MKHLDNVFHILFAGPLSWILADVIKLVRQPVQQLELWRDYIDTVWSASFVRKVKNDSENSDVIVISLSNRVYQLKIESMLAIGLRLNGRQVVPIVRSRKDRWAIRYFKSFGIDKFLYWDREKISETQLEEVKVKTEEWLWSMRQNPSTENIKSWVYKESAIGVQVLGSIFREKRTSGTGELSEEFQRLIHNRLPGILKTVLLAESLINRENPKLMYVMEANYAINGPICDIAAGKGIDLIQAVQRDRDDALICRRLNKKTRREQASSISPENIKRIMSKELTSDQWGKLQEILEGRYNGSHFLESRHHPVAKIISREELCQRFRFDPSKKIIVIYSHILWDANLFYGKDLFGDLGEWFVETIRAAYNNDQVNWLVKLHPANTWKRARENASEELEEIRLIKQEIGQINMLPKHVGYIYPDSDIGTFTLRSTTDAAVTVRGTIINELAIFGVPVFTGGTGKAAGLGFTVDSATREEYLKRLEKIQNSERLNNQQVGAARKFSYCLFNSRLWVMKSFKCIYSAVRKGGSHPLDHNLTIQCNTIDQITENGDLGKWAEWAADPSQVDYLE